MKPKKQKSIFNIIAIMCIIVFCFAISPITLQNDTYYTIKVGESISQNGVDMKDHFSWHEDLPYTYPHWAYDLGMYYIYEAGNNVGAFLKDLSFVREEREAQEKYNNLPEDANVNEILEAGAETTGSGNTFIYEIAHTINNTDFGMLFIYLSTIILACILGILLYRIGVKLTKSNLIPFIITIAVMYLLKDFIAARAQLLSYILFSLVVLFIENFLQSKKKRYLVGLVIISIILANTHVATWPFFFVLFLPYVAEYLIVSVVDIHIIAQLSLLLKQIKLFVLKKKYANIDEKTENGVEMQRENAKEEVNVDVEKREVNVEKQEKNIKDVIEKQERNIKDAIEKQEEVVQNEKVKLEKIQQKTEKMRENPYKIKVTKNKAVRWLVLVMVICVFTGLLSPAGDTPYTYLAKTMEGNTTQSINEHLPLTLYNDKQTMFVLTLFLLILIFTDTKIKLSDTFMLAGLVFMAFMSRRQVALLVIIGGLIFEKLVVELINKYAEDIYKKIEEYFSKKILGNICLIALACTISLIIFYPKRNQKFINTASYPVSAATWIIENLDLENMRIYNEYNYGSYLLFRGIPVFIDSRADLYAPEYNGTKNADGKYEGRDIFSDYINISTIGTYYENKFKEYDITHVLCVNNAKLNLFLSRNDDYKQLYKDDNFVIYERLVADN